MSTMNRRLSTLCVSATVAALTAFSGSSALADPLDLSDTPLFLSTGVQPNLIMAIDDSSSMDFEVLLPGNDGSAWWRTRTASGTCSDASGRSFVGCAANTTGTADVPETGRLNFNNSGNADATWKKYPYLFPNGCDGGNSSFRRRSCDSENDHFAIPPLNAFGWARSPEQNKAYFDPNVVYQPWTNNGSFTFSPSSQTAARFDPVFGTATDSIDLTQDRAAHSSVATTAACSNAALGTLAERINNNDPQNNQQPWWGHVFRVQTGMQIPAGTCIRVFQGVTNNTFSNWAVTPTGGVTVGVTSGSSAISDGAYVAIRYFPATFYLPTTTSLPAAYGYTGPMLTGTAPNGSTLNGYEIKPANFSSTAQYDAAIQNFANWFTYSRKRHQALRAGLGKAFIDITNMRVAGFTINNRTDVTMRDINVAANRTSLYTQFYQDWIRSGGTPNIPAVGNMVRNFRRTNADAPIQYACQRNFGMLFTDGFSNPDTFPGLPAAGNIDGNQGAPYADTVEDTMADGVMDAYLNPLRTGAGFPAGRVAAPAACSSANPPAGLDCNRNLHMNFYAVTLGTRGLQFNPDATPPQNPYASAPTWPTTFPARHPSAVDDIWHATINGRGQLLNAKSPTEISEKLTAVLTSIIEQTGSASAASVNSGSISSETRLYQAKFDSRNWTGQLLAFRVNNDGSLGAQQWDAGEQIPVHGDRRIITVNSDGTAVPFRWDSLDSVRQGQIDADATIGAARVNYLRGDSSNERPSGHGFRPRGGKKLGDIISSSPIFVGAPRFGYPDALEPDHPYSEFRREHSDTDGAGTADMSERQHVVYAGANDGMVHAFNADSGRELFAFIPSPAFRNLRTLSDPGYTHRFFVDGAPNVGDALIGDDWQTVLIGGLNRGGQGIYALNVTNPASFGENNAANMVMWEFTDADDADLGYTYAQPAIVRLRSGAWGAVVGNGYSNTEADGAVSSSGNAVLYILDLADGSVLRKIDTGVGKDDDPRGLGRPNGLSTPAVVDINGDAIVDFAYAGDLFGNLWKFDLRSTSASGWKIAFGDSSDPLPLFSARDPEDDSLAQPITSRPEVIRGPRGVGMMVLFGTGKYIEKNDKVVDTSEPEIQTYYGLFDRNGYDSDGVQLAANRIDSLEELIQQEIVAEPVVSFNGRDVSLRITTQRAQGLKGWYLNLLSPDGYEGERQVSNTIVRNGRVIFTTLIPDSDPCGAGGSSWLMELDALSGARLTETPFDLNRDGRFDERDFVRDPNGNMVPASGLQPEVGITPEPGVLIGDNGNKEFKYNPGTTGEISVTVENPGRGAAGRQSWRQVR
jgi:type IV pilus assembly protein PilY1